MSVIQCRVCGALSLVTPEEDTIRFLLDGLGVRTIQELHRLVELGRQAEAGVASIS